jgi:hypothetical protein
LIKAAASEVHIASINREIKTVRTSETFAYFYETTQPFIPEGRHIHTRSRDNLKFHIFQSYSIFPSPRAM